MSAMEPDKAVGHSAGSASRGATMRLVPFLCLLPVVFGLAACGGSAPPAASSSAVVAQAAAPAADAALEPLFGTWALDPSQCGGQVLKISKTRFEGPGSACDISGFIDNGNGSFTAAMSCAASGQTANERISMRPIFAPTGEGIDLVYLDRKNLASEVLRCPAT